MTNPLKPRDRVRIPRQEAAEQNPRIRARNFEEVSHGFDESLAQIEAIRCLDCRDPVCVRGCPVNVDIPGFIRLLLAGDLAGAGARIRETNALPAVCGRVCPQESQCERVCTMGKRFAPVAIGSLSALSRTGMAHVTPPAPASVARRLEVARGPGPRRPGLCRRPGALGHQVMVPEALHAAGGAAALRHPGVPASARGPRPRARHAAVARRRARTS